MFSGEGMLMAVVEVVVGDLAATPNIRVEASRNTSQKMCITAGCDH